jgi:hypothetical protein
VGGVAAQPYRFAVRDRPPIRTGWCGPFSVEVYRAPRSLGPCTGWRGWPSPSSPCPSPRSGCSLSESTGSASPPSSSSRGTSSSRGFRSCSRSVWRPFTVAVDHAHCCGCSVRGGSSSCPTRRTSSRFHPSRQGSSGVDDARQPGVDVWALPMLMLGRVRVQPVGSDGLKLLIFIAPRAHDRTQVMSWSPPEC